MNNFILLTLFLINLTCGLNLYEKYLLPRIIQHPQSKIVSLKDTKRIEFKCDYDTIDIFTFKTTLASSSFIEIKWLFNQLQIDQLSKYKNDFKQENNLLIINNFNSNHHLGEYRCIVNNTLISWAILSEPANLSLAYIDNFKDTLDEEITINISEGNVAVIPCPLPESNPQAIPLFYLNDNNILIDNQKRFKIFPSGNLQISNVKLSDTGVYTCSAMNTITNEIRNNTKKFKLIVNEVNSKQSPVITYAPIESNRVQIDSNLTLECVASGSPVPTITWEKFGSSLPLKRSTQIFGNLILTNIQLEDRGTYVCRADNGYATYKTAMIDVFEAPTLLTLNDGLTPTTTTTTTTNNQLNQIVKYYANLNDNIELKCPIRSRPKSDIQWFYNAQLLTNSKSSSYLITDRSLLIKNVNNKLIGVYQCFAKNEYGFKQAQILLQLKEDDNNRFSYIKNSPPALPSIQTTTQQQQQQQQPVLFASKPHILMGPQNVTIYEGQSVVLLCLTESNALINWLQNDIIIEPSLMRRFEISQVGNLRIVSAQKSDSGVYKCIASNEYGMSTAEGVVLVKDEETNLSQSDIIKIDSTQNQILKKSQKKQLPIVTRPQIEQIDFDKILLKWNLISSSDSTNDTNSSDLIDYFKIEYKTRSSSFKRWITIDEQIDSLKREYILTDLSNDDLYRFRILCVYKNSLQSYSHASIKFKLEENFVPVLKQLKQNTSEINIQIEEVWAISDTSLALKWKLEQNLTKIDGLAIYYRKTQTNDFTKIQLPLLTDTYILSNLDSNTKYELKITCNQCKMSQSIYGITLNRNLKSKSINLNELPLGHLITQIVPTQAQTNTTTNQNEILFMILGVVLGILILLLVIFVIMCIIRHRQHKLLLTKLKSQSQKLHTGSSCPTLIYDDCLKQSNKTFSTLVNSQNSNTSSEQQTPPIPQVPPPPLTLSRLTQANNTNMNININPLGYLDSNSIAYTLMKQQQQQQQNQNSNNENFYHTLTTLGTLKTIPYTCGDYNNATLNLRTHFIKQYNNGTLLGSLQPQSLTRQSFSSSSTATSLDTGTLGCDTNTRQSRKRRQTNSNRRAKKVSYEKRGDVQIANTSLNANAGDNLLIDASQQPSTIIPQSRLDENFQFLFNFDSNTNEQQNQEINANEQS